MATQQCYFAARPISLTASLGGGTIGRGLRVAKNTDGSVSLAGSGVRGFAVTGQILNDNSAYETAAGQNQPGACGLIQPGGIQPTVCISAVTTINTVLYAAASGQVDISGSVVVGMANQTCGAGDIVEVIYQNPN